ncbi:MAG: hypothetical protein PUB42_01050 [Firmicutes bacterium]|nr:hypothetical protein [Bacillota bacterium]
MASKGCIYCRCLNGGIQLFLFMRLNKDTPRKEEHYPIDSLVCNKYRNRGDLNEICNKKYYGFFPFLQM